MLEIEKQRAELIEEKMTVNIDLVTGQSSLVHEESNEFDLAAQNKAVNEFMQQ